MEFLTIVHSLFSSVLSSINVNFISALTTISIIVLYRYLNVPKNIPPGPLGLPVVGYLPFLGKNTHETFNNLARKYGHVFSLYVGNRLVVVLNSYEAIKEALIKQGETFVGRPSLQVSVADMDRYSIPTSDGDIWKVHRRFTLNVLKDLGVGKMSIEPLIMDEIQHFLDELKKIDGKPNEFSDLLVSSVANNICILIFGKRFEYNDPWFLDAMTAIKEVARSSSLVGITTFLPWLNKMPGIERILNQETLTKLRSGLKQSIYSRIDESKKNYTDGQQDCYMHTFIGVQRSKQKKEEIDHMFSDQALQENLRSLLGAGTETTANSIKWCILYMAVHPDAQRKVQKEIDDVIGKERAPCWNDRLRTPYTEAAINEAQRMATLIPNNVPHRNIKDCEIFGYQIPKNSFIVCNLWAVHNDEKLWKNPKTFWPERFLGVDGKIDANKREHLIPFSMGKRECIGISLAKMELYLYFASMLQKFTFKSSDGSTPSLEPKIGLTYAPKTFDLEAVIRR